MSEREDGFYWVFIYDAWVVAEWVDDSWWTTEFDNPIRDDEFDQIDERRIVRTEPEASV